MSPKAILEFNLPEEREDFEFAQKGIKYAIASEAFSEYLFRLFKYRDPKPNELEIYEEIKQRFIDEFEGLLS